MAILPHSLLPGPEAQAHSDRLRATIDEAIREAGGWIDFSRFMSLALYAPGLGYYSAGAVKLGAAGDFVTAPEMTPLFARTLARPVVHTLQALQGQAPEVLELGAGTGRLACDLLTALAERDAVPERYRILEVSPDLRARQEATLSSLPRALRARVEWCEHWPDAICGALVANEVLDALPVHRVGWRGAAGWVEIGVALGNGEWVQHERPLGNPRLLERLPDPSGWPVPYDTEISLAATDLVTTVGQTLRAGRVWFIDYGFPAREYYHPQRAGGTLMCHIRHHAHPDPLAFPGLQDITAHVDFTAVAQAALAVGLAVDDYGSMASWLIAEGIVEELGRLSPDQPAHYLPAASAVHRLLSPAEMGELFKVLVLRPGTGREPLPPSLAG
ncbi:MAG: SAM-dependent methyltransferase [Betaproteobacteria bacterium]|nr:SAM-dependent methyltransferase [Betaproteobacteria bacterium]MDE2622822.1 SAM-dependent methyltransferase [Betaproteobacteria bacterium]